MMENWSLYIKWDPKASSFCLLFVPPFNAHLEVCTMAALLLPPKNKHSKFPPPPGVVDIHIKTSHLIKKNTQAFHKRRNTKDKSFFPHNKTPFLRDQVFIPKAPPKPHAYPSSSCAASAAPHLDEPPPAPTTKPPPPQCDRPRARPSPTATSTSARPTTSARV